MVDGERLARVSALFAKLGSKSAEAEAKAFLFYAFVFGQSLIAAAAMPACAPPLPP